MGKYRNWRGDPTWLEQVLRDEGLNVQVIPGWRNHGHGDFGPIWGTMWHHTGADNTSAQYCYNGRSDLPGPICNIHLGRGGQVTLVAVGVAWHAGIGSWPGIPTNAGNQVLIGVEMQEDATNWPPEMWPAAVKIGAAISRVLGKNAIDSNVAHKEYGRVQGKWDPGNWDMVEFRRQIQARIDGRNPAPMLPGKNPEGWTLPGGKYYGPLDGPENSISGMYGEPAGWMAGLLKWQVAVGIPATGKYDAATRQAAINLQKKMGYNPDGLIGHGTFVAAFKKEDKVDLNTKVKSTVEGSTVEAPLWMFLMWSNGNAHRTEEKVTRLEGQVTELTKAVSELVIALADKKEA